MLVSIITADNPALRDRSLAEVCAKLEPITLLEQCLELDTFRRESGNLYHRVRAIFFLYAIYRFHLPDKLPAEATGSIPFTGYEDLLGRRFEEAIDTFLAEQSKEGPSDAICSSLAAAYHQLAFQTLADQVRKSVRTVRGNQWMFRMGHPADHPLRIRPELLNLTENLFPVLRERTPVRMDLTHSAWSDIFFSAWTSPREPASSMSPSISPCMVATIAPSLPSRPTSVSSTNQPFA